MSDTKARDLSAHRLDKARGLLDQADVLLQHGSYDGSINRSYYAIFNAIRSLLAFLRLDSRRHSGVISFFDRYFVKTGIFEKSSSQMVHTAFEIRQVSDYEDFFMPTQEEAQQQLEQARTLIEQVAQKREQLLDETIPLPSTK